jgi:hypothetical protein
MLSVARFVIEGYIKNPFDNSMYSIYEGVENVEEHKKKF